MVVELILATAEAEYFLWRGWTVFLLISPAGGFVDAAAEIYTRHSQPSGGRPHYGDSHITILR